MIRLTYYIEFYRYLRISKIPNKQSSLHKIRYFLLLPLANGTLKTYTVGFLVKKKEFHISRTTAWASCTGNEYVNSHASKKSFMRRPICDVQSCDNYIKTVGNLRCRICHYMSRTWALTPRSNITGPWLPTGTKMARISDCAHATLCRTWLFQLHLIKQINCVRKNRPLAWYSRLGDAIRHSIKFTLLCEWVDMQIICFTNYTQLG